jgi:PAS domain S-box-containing protein
VLGLSHHTLFHSSSTALDIIDHQGNILDCNEAFARFVGYSRDVLLEKGTTFLGLTHPDSLAASYKLMRPLVSGQKKVTRAVKKYVCSNGTVKNSIVTCWLLHSDNGAEADSSAAAASSAAGSSASSQGSGLGAVAAAAPSSSSGGSRILLQAMIEEIPLDINEAQLAQLIPDETVLESIRSGGSLGATASAAEMQGLPVKLETTLSSPVVLAAAAAATDAATSTLPARSS